MSFWSSLTAQRPSQDLMGLEFRTDGYPGYIEVFLLGYTWVIQGLGNVWGKPVNFNSHSDGALEEVACMFLILLPLSDCLVNQDMRLTGTKVARIVIMRAHTVI